MKDWSRLGEAVFNDMSVADDGEVGERELDRAD